jgi:hypothetical protein
MDTMSIREDLNYGLAAFGVQIPEGVSVDEWAAKLTDKPLQNTLALVAVSSVLFYLAERGRNPKVQDIYDALIYCSTNMSVGYSDIFAKTPLGKLVGTAVMTIGPGMAARTLDGVGDRQRDATQAQVLDTLQQILAALKPPAPASEPARDRNGHD